MDLALQGYPRLVGQPAPRADRRRPAGGADRLGAGVEAGMVHGIRLRGPGQGHQPAQQVPGRDELGIDAATFLGRAAGRRVAGGLCARGQRLLGRSGEQPGDGGRRADGRHGARACLGLGRAPLSGVSGAGRPVDGRCGVGTRALAQRPRGRGAARGAGGGDLPRGWGAGVRHLGAVGDRAGLCLAGRADRAGGVAALDAHLWVRCRRTRRRPAVRHARRAGRGGRGGGRSGGSRRACGGRDHPRALARAGGARAAEPCRGGGRPCHCDGRGDAAGAEPDDRVGQRVAAGPDARRGAGRRRALAGRVRRGAGPAAAGAAAVEGAAWSGRRDRAG